ncbi:L,D-transpeptidase family protein [Flavobacterium macacae]|uniref:L,D-TPase catalytic domain-containing protein n=1 Tax=Flavobacterium macacae TaxID=2488993 RepID=A0A3P3WBK7_9FLAO|nr:L,D-transpeptidase family protein [Flavobacterium macacae]RRJ92561.1 hypothetical protein EG849_06150 [Flavobacterium macacae]
MKKMIYVLLLLIFGVATYYIYPEAKLPKGKIIDRIEVLKSQRKMLVYSEGELLKTYTISLGKNPIGHKEFEGDFKTPEGIYEINAKNPNSGYHKNLGVSYPNEKDIAHSKSLGKPTGGDIKIHGIRNGAGSISKFQRWKDWTAGCIAVTNEEMDELYESVKIGATIEIKK